MDRRMFGNRNENNIDKSVFKLNLLSSPFCATKNFLFCKLVVRWASVPCRMHAVHLSANLGVKIDSKPVHLNWASNLFEIKCIVECSTDQRSFADLNSVERFLKILSQRPIVLPLKQLFSIAIILD